MWRAPGQSVATAFDALLMVIGYDSVRNHAGSLDRLQKEGIGTGGVAALTHQDVDDHAALINRTVEVALASPLERKHLVHGQASVDRTPPASHLGCEPWPNAWTLSRIVR
jgi:hypothetical protein